MYLNRSRTSQNFRLSSRTFSTTSLYFLNLISTLNPFLRLAKTILFPLGESSEDRDSTRTSRTTMTIWQSLYHWLRWKGTLKGVETLSSYNSSPYQRGRGSHIFHLLWSLLRARITVTLKLLRKHETVKIASNLRDIIHLLLNSNTSSRSVLFRAQLIAII